MEQFDYDDKCKYLKDTLKHVDDMRESASACVHTIIPGLVAEVSERVEAAISRMEEISFKHSLEPDTHAEIDGFVLGVRKDCDVLVGFCDDLVKSLLVLVDQLDGMYAVGEQVRGGFTVKQWVTSREQDLIWEYDSLVYLAGDSQKVVHEDYMAVRDWVCDGERDRFGEHLKELLRSLDGVDPTWFEPVITVISGCASRLKEFVLGLEPVCGVDDEDRFLIPVGLNMANIMLDM